MGIIRIYSHRRRGHVQWGLILVLVVCLIKRLRRLTLGWECLVRSLLQSVVFLINLSWLLVLLIVALIVWNIALLPSIGLLLIQILFELVLQSVLSGNILTNKSLGSLFFDPRLHSLHKINFIKVD